MPRRDPTDDRAPSGRRAHVYLLVTVLVVAANLRGAITAVGPVIDDLGADTGLSAGALGLLGAVPLLTFAVVSPLVHALARRTGTEPAVGIALFVLAAGTTLRSVTAVPGSLWVGTVLLAGAIAVGNVLVPALVKRDFPDRVPVVTGVYSAVMSGFAAVASGIAVPLAAIGGWQLALGAWAGLALLGALLWLPRTRAHTPPPDDDPQPLGVAPWRSATAWQVALFMGLQSSGYYLLVTWLPEIEHDRSGTSHASAGWLLFAMQIVGIVAGLAVGPVLHRLRDQRLAAAGVSGLMVLAAVGLIVAPGAHVLWVLLAGASSGASLVVALSLFAARTRTARDAGRLSGMAQGVGYLVAAGGPTVAGLLHDATGAWAATLGLVACVAAAQAVVGLLAGRNRYVGEPLPAP
ncbi:MFS transporter [Luteimicrobium sp. DT211]|uniref:MFS transporter n=1 Tax=Luteimicrobium sp. DT211 TaxID=3393412 RepID=UPI003CF8CE5F